MVLALLKEIELSIDFLASRKLDSIYFGGGTPSLLHTDEINRILEQIARFYDLNDLKEVTLETNPDDLSATYLKNLSDTIIDRLSIGIQSFQEEDLKLMNRAHTAGEAEAAIKRAQDAGFENLNADLIFGTPTLSDEGLKENIDFLTEWEVPHISAYALTIEKMTSLHHQVKTGKIQPYSDEQYNQQMLLTMSRLAEAGYEQYEISNYAKNKMYAIHNTSYWQGAAYLGIGPSAHSFTDHIRRWNVRNNASYIRSVLGEQKIPFESELLSERDRINEKIMTHFRTQWGLNLLEVEKEFGSAIAQKLKEGIHFFMAKGQITQNEDSYILTQSGKLMADHICSELFFTEENFE